MTHFTVLLIKNKNVASRLVTEAEGCINFFTNRCVSLQDDVRASLDRLIEIENKEVWTEKRTPERDDEGLLTAHIDMDIWTVRRCTNTSVKVSLKHVDKINKTVKHNKIMNSESHPLVAVWRCGHEGAADGFTFVSLLTCVTVCIVSLCRTLKEPS